MKILLTILIMIGGIVGVFTIFLGLMWIMTKVDKYIYSLRKTYSWFDKLIKVLKVIIDIIIGLVMLFFMFVIGYGIYIRL